MNAVHCIDFNNTKLPSTVKVANIQVHTPIGTGVVDTATLHMSDTPAAKAHEDKVIEWIEDAMAQRADLIVLPELSTSARVEAETLARLQKLSYDCIVVCGSYYRNRINQAPILCRLDGKVQTVYRQGKLEPSEIEKGIMERARERYIIFNTGLGDLAVLICYDSNDWVIFQHLEGLVDMVVVIAYNKAGGTFHDRFTRACYSHYYTIVFCNDGAFGDSSFYFPYKNAGIRQISKVPASWEGMTMMDLPIDTLDRARCGAAVNYGNDALAYPPGNVRREDSRYDPPYKRLPQYFRNLVERKTWVFLPPHLQAALVNRDNNCYYRVEKIITTIGKASHNAICLPMQKSVSPYHAVLSYENDAFFLLDWMSKEGTWLNQRRISDTISREGEPPKLPMVLPQGARIGPEQPALQMPTPSEIRPQNFFHKMLCSVTGASRKMIPALSDLEGPQISVGPDTHFVFHSEVLGNATSAMAAGMTEAADTQPSPEQRPQIPGDRYKIEGEGKSGGQGTLFRALDCRQRRYVGVRWLPGSVLPEKSAQRDALLARCEVLCQLRHNHILEMYEVLSSGLSERGELFLVMQWIDGESLRQLLPEINVSQSLEIIHDLACALAHLHGQSIIHGNIKPDNVIREYQSERAVLADFALVHGPKNNAPSTTGKDACTAMFVYMAPEQQKAGIAHQESDIYALGAVFYELLQKRAIAADELARRPEKLEKELFQKLERGLGEAQAATDIARLCLQMLAPESSARPALSNIISKLHSYLPQACLLCGQKTAYKDLFKCKTCHRPGICHTYCYDPTHDQCLECSAQKAPARVNLQTRPVPTGLARLDNPRATFSVRVWSENKLTPERLTRDISVVPRREYSQYKVWDKVEVLFQSSEACYVYFFNIAPTGEVSLLFPNRYARNNRVDPNEIYRFPDTRANFDWELRPPTSAEIVKVFATKRPVAIDQIIATTEPFSKIPRQHLAVVSEVFANLLVDTWAEASCTLLVRSKRLEEMSGSQTIHVIHDLAQALQAIHRRGNVHGDLTPARVSFETATGNEVLEEFGMVKLLVGGSQETSDQRKSQKRQEARYRSPEQWQAKPAVPASDVYALGVIFYDMVMKRVDAQGLLALPTKVYADADCVEELAKAVNDRGGGKKLAQLCDRMLALIPEKRPTTEEIIATLAAYLPPKCPLCGVPTPSMDTFICSKCGRSGICRTHCYDKAAKQCLACSAGQSSPQEPVPEPVSVEEHGAQEAGLQARIWTEDKLRPVRFTRSIAVIPRLEFSQYKAGDTVEVLFQSNRDCFVYFFNIGPQGKVTLLFPNQFTQENRVQRHTKYTFPDPKADFVWKLEPPTGTETVTLFAATKPVDISTWLEQTNAGFHVRNDDLRPISAKFEELPAGEWAEAGCKLVVRA